MPFRRLIPTVLAALALTDVVGAQNALAGSPASFPGTARIQVTATVVPRASLRVLHQERVLNVTPEDISRGYVDAPGSTRVELQDNSPRGHLLVFDDSGAPESPVERASVRGLGTEFDIGAGGGFVPRPHARGPVSAELSYRFSLSRDARPGAYRWPFFLSIRPR